LEVPVAAPDCSMYEVTLNRVRELIAGERPVQNLRQYLTSYSGARFDHLTDSVASDELTPAGLPRCAPP
jgi:hypothetical protein